MPESTLNEHPEIRLIVVDLDGTLLNSQHALSDRNQKAVQAAIAAGVNVVLATGKTRHAAQDIIKTLSLSTPGVFVQGNVTYNGDGSIRNQQILDTAVVRKILTYVQERGFEALVYSGSLIMTRRKSQWTDLVETYGEPPATVTPDLYQKLPDIKINKLCIGGEESRIRALVWQINKQFQGQVAVTRANVEGMMEILPSGYSKGRGVAALIRDLGLDPKNVMALGDGENDLDMLKAVGMPIAVGNAQQVLKDVAKYVVGTNDEDGVAEAIERFVLKTQAPESMPDVSITVDATTPEDATTAEIGTETPPAVSEAVEKAEEADLPVVMALETLEVQSLANAAPPIDAEETPETPKKD